MDTAELSSAYQHCFVIEESQISSSSSIIGLVEISGQAKEGRCKGQGGRAGLICGKHNVSLLGLGQDDRNGSAKC